MVTLGERSVNKDSFSPPIILFTIPQTACLRKPRPGGEAEPPVSQLSCHIPPLRGGLALPCPLPASQRPWPPPSPHQAPTGSSLLTGSSSFLPRCSGGTVSGNPGTHSAAQDTRPFPAGQAAGAKVDVNMSARPYPSHAGSVPSHAGSVPIPAVYALLWRGQNKINPPHFLFLLVKIS